MSTASCSRPIKHTFSQRGLYTFQRLTHVVRESGAQFTEIITTKCPSDSYVTINLFGLWRNKNIVAPLLSSSSVLATVFPSPRLKPDSDRLQCGCSGKPVDYPNCFMTKAYPAIMLLCHWETYSQTRTLRHTLSDTLRRHKCRQQEPRLL